MSNPKTIEPKFVYLTRKPWGQWSNTTEDYVKGAIAALYPEKQRALALKDLQVFGNMAFQYLEFKAAKRS